MPTVCKQSRMPVDAAAVERWHAAEGAFERLAPPWQFVQVIERRGGLADGRIRFRIGNGPLRWNWIAQHRDYVPGRQFVDEQVQGPFARWVHTHRFHPRDDHTCDLEDEIEFELPVGRLGKLLAGGKIAGDLDRAFTFRHLRTRNDLLRHARHADQPRQTVAISGSSGMVGRNLGAFLTSGGHCVQRLVRRQTTSTGEIQWNPADGTVDAPALEGLDAVVHLAGENIAAGRWTAARKQRILNSRVNGTRLLCETLAKLAQPPSTLVSASAIGFYGSGDQPFTEQTPAGEGFLAEVCREWEAATAPAREAGIRVVQLRIGVVLSPQGGALAKMLTPFSLGCGGVVGSGRQWMSWIGLDDLVGIIHESLFDPRYEGPLNATSPQPVTNRTFTKTLGRVLRRPTLFPLPAPVVKAAFGQMGEECLLAGAQVLPARLEERDFPFQHPDLESALRFELGRFAGDELKTTQPTSDQKPTLAKVG